MSIKEFKFIKLLGKGAFGKVDLVQRKEDGQIYAMKSVKISQLNTKEQENALNEVRVLASICHPNIIGYKEAFFDSETQTLNIVMEFAEDGDLESKIKNHIKNKTHFPENEIWSYLIQMIEGLKALHDIKTMHRDLKSANVFIMKNGQVKLGDLNVSKVVKMGMVQTQTGTPYYASPEVWADKPYDYKSDIWSVGCVLYELCALKPPFRGNNIQQLYASVSKGKNLKILNSLGVYEPIPNIYSNDLHKVLALLLQTNPLNRPNCDMLLSNPIFLKRMDYTKTFGYGGNNQLLNTIKLPKNFNEINQKLPKTKKYIEPTGLTFLKKTETKTIQEHDYIEKKIGSNEIKNNMIRQKTIEQEITLKKEEPIKRPVSSKPDSRYRTPLITNKKENVSSSKPVSMQTKNTNSVLSNRRVEIPTNYINNQLNENNHYNNMKISPNSSNVRGGNNTSNSQNKQETNRGGININSKNDQLHLGQIPNVTKPVRASSARPSNSKIGLLIVKENPVISNLYKDMISTEKEKTDAYNIPNNPIKNILNKNLLERPPSAKALHNNYPHQNLNSNINNPLNPNIKQNVLNLPNPSSLVTNNYNNINININNNYYSNKPQYEYKSPYKQNNPNPILRPSSCRERSHPIHPMNMINNGNNNGNNHLQNQNVIKKLIPNKDNEHKILINPIKIVETPSKRLLTNNHGINTNVLLNNPTRANNNFLKVNRPIYSSPYEPGQYGGGMIKIIQNNDVRPINYKK